MTLRHLTVFTAVADNNCSITKASESLHVAQPSVSQTIAELEQYYNIKLFDRLNRHLYLTPEGKKLYGYARHLVGSYKELDTLMKTVSGTLPLRIGASFTAGTAFLPGILHTVHDLSADITVCNTHNIEEMILASTLDAAVVEGEIHSSDIIQIPVMQDTLIFAAAHSYILSKEPVFILREPGSGTRELSDIMIEQVFPDIKQPRIWTAANTQTIIELVKNSLGLTIISRSLIQKELDTGIIQQIIFPQNIQNSSRSRTFRLIYHKDKFLDSRMQKFIQKCRNDQ